MDSNKHGIFGVIFLLIASFCSSYSQTACEKGWFGESCQFLCHCADHGDCNKTDGTCSKGCDQQWFGPGCQYVKSEFSIPGGSGSDLSWLTDNNDNTCNEGNVDAITLSLETPQPLSWIRVVSKAGTDHRKLVDLSYQISTPCKSTHIRKIDDTIFDIFCTSKYDASHVTLTGRAVKGLCSLNIDGDQNTNAWTINNESGSDLSWLTDNDDKTCNNGNIQSITVTLQKPCSVSLVRFTVRSAEYTGQFQLSYTASSQRFRACDNPRSAKVDDKTVDISCSTSDVVSYVRLSGNIVKGLCSLFISGGRNVALKQSSLQSSTYNKGGITWSASNAVDGYPGIPDDITSLISTCSHTIPDNNPVWWNLTFSDPVKIAKISIYNRREPTKGNSFKGLY
ncbi:multiple epidermal growth factor-like domains protein 6 [Plakobranchus ocellatus]|uniref:Multiple epidermal growth factor-like domains protein 6 n=1 Tax=Plakobranchus ocellatus TaxID=259542 RepID=A0AAV4BFB2_9GAST|nr:multiple epidermal growth factor-like domains protein 6 [Plakobranchus ocellatus]